MTTKSERATIKELARRIRETPDVPEVRSGRRMEALLRSIEKKHGARMLIEALDEAHKQWTIEAAQKKGPRPR